MFKYQQLVGDMDNIYTGHCYLGRICTNKINQQSIGTVRYKASYLKSNAEH